MHPERVGNIRIEKVLGQGGMGTVYVGVDEKLERRVALKAIRSERRLSEAVRQRFEFEARVLSKLEHPNICRIHEYVEDGDTAYLVLEYVEGHTLAAHLESHTLQAHHRLSIAIQIADALAAAHAAGVVHRDLKPDNVIITLEGDAKVLDFGLARSVQAVSDAPPAGAVSEAATATAAGSTSPTPAPDTPTSTAPLRTPTNSLLLTEAGAIMGTPLFMSPEQARGLTDEITTASDMYSFGLLLQALWTSESPYPAGLSRAELLERARRGEARRPSGMPRPVARLVERLRAVDPAARAPAVQARHLLRRYETRPARLLRQAAAALLVLLAVGAATKYTVDLRHERGLAQDAAHEQRRLRELADTRRDLAEGLIGFMLDDLFTKLRGAGRLELLDDVDREALDYFAALPEGELSTEELSRRAQTLYQIGEVSIERGDLPAALEAFEESLALQQAVVAEEPANQSALVQLGYAHFWMGSGHWNLGDLDAARDEFETSAEVARRLVALDPGNPQYKLELATEIGNMAQVLEAQGAYDDAATLMRAQTATVEALAASDPARDDWQLELANSRLLTGRLLEAQEATRDAPDYTDAEAAYRADLELMLELVGRDPEHAEHLDRLGTSYSYLGNLLEKRAQYDEAEACFEEQRAVSARLAAGDAQNAGWRDHVASGLANLGKLRMKAGKLDAARDPLRRAAEIYIELSEQDPTRERWRIEALGAGADYAELLTALDEFERGHELVERSLALVPGDAPASLSEGARFEYDRLLAFADFADG